MKSHRESRDQTHFIPRKRWQIGKDGNQSCYVEESIYLFSIYLNIIIDILYIYIYICTLCKQFTSRSCSQCCTRLFHEQQDEKYFFLYSLKEEPIRVSISPCWFKLYSSQLQAIRVEWGNLTMSCTQLLLGKFRTQKQSWRVAVVFLWNATLKLAEAIILTMF